MSSDNSCRFAVVGAGPYGMAVAAHLRGAGHDVRVFGRVMDFWHSRMPKGMMLRSPWEGSHISDPGRTLTLNHYAAAHRFERPKLLPLEEFVRYGRWFQAQTLPDVDERSVDEVEKTGDGFRIRLADGDVVEAERVVMATGIGSFAHRPAPFADLPPKSASHASDARNQDLSQYRGKRMSVIGAGQSAIESAALLYELGADVELLVRKPRVRWLSPSGLLEWLQDLPVHPFGAPGKIGPIGMNWLIEHPRLFTSFPRGLQQKMTYRAIRPAGSSWLRPRTQSVKFRTGVDVTAAKVQGERVHLSLSDGSTSDFDHVFLGTGYKIDVSRHELLSSGIRSGLKLASGYPVLDRGFESSIPGLYFVGAPAAYSFGPLCRFVAGTDFTARRLAKMVPAGARRPKLCPA
jgi:cation diffusion facilitator CzcD-associated flavoprotein CzcO